MGLAELLPADLDRLARAQRRSGCRWPSAATSYVDVAGSRAGGWAHRSMSADAEAGIPPGVILQMMTTNAARLLGVERSGRHPAGPGRGHRGHPRQPARGHQAPRDRRLRDEGRPGHQAALTFHAARLRRSSGRTSAIRMRTRPKVQTMAAPVGRSSWTER